MSKKIEIRFKLDPSIERDKKIIDWLENSHITRREWPTEVRKRLAEAINGNGAQKKQDEARTVKTPNNGNEKDKNIDKKLSAFTSF